MHRRILLRELTEGKKGEASDISECDAEDENEPASERDVTSRYEGEAYSYHNTG